MRDAELKVDENGMFDIEDEAVLQMIAGGLSADATFLDNHCTTNDSKCGKTTSPTLS